MGLSTSNLARSFLTGLLCLLPTARSTATSEVVLRSPHRIVLAADSRAVYSGNRIASECKLLEVGDVFATVSGFAHDGRSFPAATAVYEGFGGYGSFAEHVSRTAYSLQRMLQSRMSRLDPREAGAYGARPADFVQLAVAEVVRGEPMLGIIELRPDARTGQLNLHTTVCPGACSRSTNIFYLGYWEQIQPYVARSGQPRNVGSAASIDRLIRMEAYAHPHEVAPPINILELTGAGARWLQNGGNCSLPGVR